MTEQGGTVEFFGPLLDESSKIKREAVRRRKQFDEKSIIAEQITEYEAEGWQVDRRLKRSIRVKRPKAIDERLENRFWMLLARLGYPEINAGRKFTILIDRKGAEPLRKQVDVFAKDDETVIVAECKASGSFSRRILALIVRHPLYSQRSAAERVGQQPLQGFHFAVTAFLCCLDDARLQSPDPLLTLRPVDPFPLRC